MYCLCFRQLTLQKKLSLQYVLTVWFYFANVCTEASDRYREIYGVTELSDRSSYVKRFSLMCDKAVHVKFKPVLARKYHHGIKQVCLTRLSFIYP